MMKSISPKEMDQNVFSLIGDVWTLITAGTKDNCNTMTASWGGVGIIWGKPSATIYVRPQRYTKEFIDAQEYFTLSFMAESHRDSLKLCGSKSGRDVNKFEACGFTVEVGAGDAPYIGEADVVIVCKKRYVQLMDKEQMPAEVRTQFYPGEDYHYIYMGEIVEVLVKE